MSRVLIARNVTGADCFSQANATGRVSLFPLEHDLLEAIVRQALADNEMWRRQIDHLQVRSRSFTSTGFCSLFLLADPTMVVMPFVTNEVVSGWIRTDLPGQAGSIDHILHLERGTMVRLEGMASGEFPAEIGSYKVADGRRNARVA